MGKKKNQHYVPQSYLRLFSTDKKNIGIYTIYNNITTVGPINDQASEKYFYSKDITIENALQEIENLGIDSFKKLINHDGYKWENIEYLNAYVYVIIQYARTLYAAKKYQKEVQELQFNLNKINSHIVVKSDSPQLVSLKIYANMLSCCLDLKYKILKIDKKCNGEKFLTSDNPVCIFNPLWEIINLKKEITLEHKGIIILFTISPEHAIIIYDAEVYKIGNKRGWVNIINPKDISIINKIVTANANEVLYHIQNNQINASIKEFIFYNNREDDRRLKLSSSQENCSLSFIHFLSKIKPLFNHSNITNDFMYRRYILYLHNNPHIKESLDCKWGTGKEEERKLFYKKLNERYMVYKNTHNVTIK